MSDKTLVRAKAALLTPYDIDLRGVHPTSMKFCLLFNLNCLNSSLASSVYTPLHVI